MKPFTNLRKFIIKFLVLSLLIGGLPFYLLSGNKVYAAIGSGTQSDPIDKREYHSEFLRLNRNQVPIASFTIDVLREGKKIDSITSTAFYEDHTNSTPFIYARVGDTLKFTNNSVPGIGKSIKKLDFQDSEIGQRPFPKEITVDEVGTITYFLNVQQSDGRHSANGNQLTLGKPFQNNVNWWNWYFSKVSIVRVEKDDDEEEEEEEEDPLPPYRAPIEEPVLPSIPLLPPIVYEIPRASNLAVKWLTVPIGIGSRSSIEGKIQRDSVVTWNEYKYIVETWYPNETVGSKINTQTIKTVGFNNDMFLKGNGAWFSDAMPSYTVPSNAKPGTVLIVKLSLTKRTSDIFPSSPPTPQKPQPEVPKPSYSRPTKPTKPSKPKKPGKDADDDAKERYSDAMDDYSDSLDAYYDRLDNYYDKIGPWNDYDDYIASPAYQEYLLRVADVNKVNSVRTSYNTSVNGNPTLSAVSGYNFSEYANYHTAYNSFVNDHLKRYVSVEGDTHKVYWFRTSSRVDVAQSKNVVVHNVVDPGKGGLNPGIIIKP